MARIGPRRRMLRDLYRAYRYPRHLVRKVLILCSSTVMAVRLFFAFKKKVSVSNIAAARNGTNRFLLQTTQCLPHTASTTSLHRLVAPHQYNIICVVKVKLSALFVQSVRLVFLTNVPKKSSLVLEERK